MIQRMNEGMRTFVAAVPCYLPALGAGIQQMFDGCADGVPGCPVQIGINNLCYSGQRPEIIETTAGIGKSQDYDAALLEYFVTVIDKRDQVGCMFNDMRSNDPVVIPGSADQIGVFFTMPDKIDIFYVFKIDIVAGVFGNQSRLVQMIDNMDVIAFLPGSNRIMARPDLDADAFFINMFLYQIVAQHNVSLRKSADIFSSLARPYHGVLFCREGRQQDPASSWTGMISALTRQTARKAAGTEAP